MRIIITRLHIHGQPICIKVVLCEAQKQRNLHHQLSPVFSVQVDIGGFRHQFEMYCQGNPVADGYNKAVCNGSIKECHIW